MSFKNNGKAKIWLQGVIILAAILIGGVIGDALNNPANDIGITITGIAVFTILTGALIYFYKAWNRQ
jgi:hypothetical protein